jgi:hypothetical protein
MINIGDVVRVPLGDADFGGCIATAMRSRRVSPTGQTFTRATVWSAS